MSRLTRDDCRAGSASMGANDRLQTSIGRSAVVHGVAIENSPPRTAEVTGASVVDPASQPVVVEFVSFTPQVLSRDEDGLTPSSISGARRQE